VFHLAGRTAAAYLRQQDEMDSVIGKLIEHDYRPLLRTAAQSISDCTGVSIDASVAWQVFSDRAYRRPGTELGVIGDMIFHGNHAYLLQPIRRGLWAWEVRHHTHPSSIDGFCEHITDAARSTIDGRRLRGMSFEWKHASLPPRTSLGRARRQHVPEIQAQPAIYSQDDLERSLVLLNRAQREFLIRLGQVGKARSIDTRADSEEANTAQLMEAGLVSLDISRVARRGVRSPDSGERGRLTRCAVSAGG
jgi:hypothetical protein